jgi:hypothetical protein
VIFAFENLMSVFIVKLERNPVQSGGKGNKYPVLKGLICMKKLLSLSR